MKNRNIAEAFERFSPSEEQKGEIYRSIVTGQKRGQKAALHFKAIFACCAGACLVLAAAAAILLSDPAHTAPQLPEGTQYVRADKTPVSSGPVVTDQKAGFDGFILTAYAANGEADYLSANFSEEAEKLTLEPEVKVLLAKYSPAMSSVPGLPFTVNIAGDQDTGGIDAIHVSADSGTLNGWDRDTGIVSSRGRSATIDIGETIYWSPIFEESATDIRRATIIVEAVSDNTVLGRQEIFIIQEEPGCYYATVGELELL